MVSSRNFNVRYLPSVSQVFYCYMSHGASSIVIGKMWNPIAGR